MSIKSKLDRMKNHLQLDEKKEIGSALKEKDFKHQKNHPNDTTIEESFRHIGFEPFYFDGERSYRKRIVYPYQTEQQIDTYEGMKRMKAFWDHQLSDHPLSFRGKPLEQLLFFDTETTGLSTGAGNVIFLIGYARLKEEGIEVTQHLLESPSNEVAFLSGFLEDFQEDDYLISYNGKSFDWPQVKSRHTFMRQKLPNLPAFGHIDLLHCSRRLWKHLLPSCRLAIVEERILNIHRTNDIPGSMAPLLYFDYLHDKDPDHLKGVINHNDQDVRSLISLYLAITDRLFNWKKAKPKPLEHFYIADWFEKMNEVEWAKIHYHQAIEQMNQPFARGYYRLGLLYKKLGDKQQATSFFLDAVNQGAFPPIEVWIELSKLAEHDQKDFSKAYGYAKKAILQMKNRLRIDENRNNYHKHTSDLNKRLNRLEKKINL